MINPVRALKGKLNYLKVPNSHLYKLMQLVNSTPNNSKSFLDTISFEEIKSLKSEQNITTP